MTSLGALTWWLILFVQGVSFAWVSRARSSGAIGYASLVGVFSHGLWFVAQVFLVTSIFDAARQGPRALVAAGLLYTSAMVLGQAVAMWASIRYLERGRRRVGG